MVLLAAALISGHAISVEPSRATPHKMPSYLDRTLYAGGDGLSKKTAVIVEARNEAVGVGSEYAWIASRYPDAKALEQLLTARDEEEKTYDVITVRTSMGAEMLVWFDISAMYQWDMDLDHRWTDRERIWLQVQRFWAAPQLHR